MVEGMYHKIAETWRRLYRERSDVLKQRIVAARHEHAIVRVERPSRLDRARALGYKAKQGFIVVRIRVGKGGMRRKRARAGRRPKHIGVVKIKQAESMKRVAERRVAERYPNMDVRGSYYLFEDGRYYWFECILVDRAHGAVKNDRELVHQLSH
ncbi:MAG: 50S ribosomal protein L15e [Candidatus Nitrosocaldus sp.]|nr:50S ribosomal protein L15e [Candidatus Nitrosocaldus sp.]MDW7999422.1 50S ribosomal protein L15e [Candidatus Nitrosocaldus sp.]